MVVELCLGALTEEFQLQILYLMQNEKEKS
jgi:hypothetical protein